MEMNYNFKILVVGCGGVGKTCCIRKIVYNTFTTEYRTTIGVDFAFKAIKIDNQNVRLQLWDIAGQERFSNLTRAYYKDAMGCLVVGDLEADTIVNDVQLWKEDIDSKVHFPDTEDRIPAVLLCNKFDKPQAQERWQDQKIQDELKDLNFDGIYPTSAQTGEGLDEALQFLCSKILAILQTKGAQPQTNEVIGVVIPAEEVQSKKGCCK